MHGALAAECRVVLAATRPTSTAIQESVSLVERLQNSILAVLNEMRWGDDEGGNSEESDGIEPWHLFEHGEALLSCIRQMGKEKGDFVLIYEAFYRRSCLLLLVLLVSLYLIRGHYRGVMTLMKAAPEAGFASNLVGSNLEIRERMPEDLDYLSEMLHGGAVGLSPGMGTIRSTSPALAYLDSFTFKFLKSFVDRVLERGRGSKSAAQHQGPPFEETLLSRCLGKWLLRTSSRLHVSAGECISKVHADILEDSEEYRTTASLSELWCFLRRRPELEDFVSRAS